MTRILSEFREGTEKEVERTEDKHPPPPEPGSEPVPSQVLLNVFTVISIIQFKQPWESPGKSGSNSQKAHFQQRRRESWRSASIQTGPTGGPCGPEHPNFALMQQSYSAFKYYSRFLFKVVSKLVNRGYQPHLEDFLLRINFNNYYQDS
ncbi:hypothetical protein R6Z07F_009451 [Ovis aries]